MPYPSVQGILALPAGDKNLDWEEIDIVDLIDDPKEFAAALQVSRGISADIADYFLESLNRWNHVVVPDGLVEQFPLAASKLQSQTARRIFARFADCCSCDLVVVASILEHILRERAAGAARVEFNHGWSKENYSVSVLERMSYFSDVAARSFRKFFLSCLSSGLEVGPEKSVLCFEWA